MNSSEAVAARMICVFMVCIPFMSSNAPHDVKTGELLTLFPLVIYGWPFQPRASRVLAKSIHRERGRYRELAIGIDVPLIRSSFIKKT